MAIYFPCNCWICVVGSRSTQLTQKRDRCMLGRKYRSAPGLLWDECRGTCCRVCRLVLCTVTFENVNVYHDLFVPVPALGRNARNLYTWLLFLPKPWNVQVWNMCERLSPTNLNSNPRVTAKIPFRGEHLNREEWETYSVFPPIHGEYPPRPKTNSRACM